MTTNTMINTDTQFYQCNQIVLDKGTGSESANAVTINNQAGVITTSSLSVANNGTYSITFTNSFITSSSVILLGWMGGTINKSEFYFSIVAGSGSATLKIINKSGGTMTGTVLIGFAVF